MFRRRLPDLTIFHNCRARKRRCKGGVRLARMSRFPAAASLSSSARVRANDPAARANHARPETGHRRVMRPTLGAPDGPVVALSARHRERPHAIVARVAERHRLDRFVGARACHRRRIANEKARREAGLFRTLGVVAFASHMGNWVLKITKAKVERRRRLIATSAFCMGSRARLIMSESAGVPDRTGRVRSRSQASINRL
jgi:hypothetical protein